MLPQKINNKKYNKKDPNRHEINNVRNHQIQSNMKKPLVPL